MKRRDFIKYISISSLGICLLPRYNLHSPINHPAEIKSFEHNPHWLIGSPVKGCSTSNLSIECFDSIQNGLDDFNHFRLPEVYV
ncbi:MAG: hypothetical protein MUO85_06790 [candidate division Zixibacteria bacterium]|nr:hypothetical protein [candidate division Zixibacteria bacterium]